MSQPSWRLERVHIENYRSILRQTLELGEVTVLVGRVADSPGLATRMDLHRVMASSDSFRVFVDRVRLLVEQLDHQAAPA